MTTARIDTDEHSTTIERTFETTPERLFEAWTDPELFCQWMGPGPMTCTVPIYEPKPGGRFRIEMTGPTMDGSPGHFVYEGTFDEVTPNERIVMSWPPAGEGEDPGPPSIVTVTFTKVEGGTQMRLTQDGLPGVDFAKGASMGWESSFEKLAQVV